MSTQSVRTGAQRVVEDVTLVPGARWGLLTNYTGVLPDLEPTSVGLLRAGAPLVALFGPEHGLGGTAQAGFSEAAEVDEITGLRVFDTYEKDVEGIAAQIDEAGIDVLLVDLQDIGVRYYTYVWSLVDSLHAAVIAGVPVVVLDRPNPLGGEVVEGPTLDPACASFVGRFPVRLRHGLTIGEMADLANVVDVAPARGTAADLTVVEMRGWHRSTTWDATGLPWVLPSPNVPTPTTALAYAGTGLFEGTTMSEGRGTTRPFELVGAPWMDGRLAAELRGLGLPGVLFRDASFAPTFHKFAGSTARGVQLHVTDTRAFRPVRTALEMLAAAWRLYPDDVAWRVSDGGEALTTTRYFADLLWGAPSLRAALDAGRDPLELLPPDGTPYDTAAQAGTTLRYA